MAKIQSNDRFGFNLKRCARKASKKACKYLIYKPLSWVPGRTRTVDIQNHNLTL